MDFFTEPPSGAGWPECICWLYIWGKTEPHAVLQDRFRQQCAPLWAELSLICVLSCGLSARQPLAQPISLIRPLEEVPEDALLTAVCLPSYFLTHWHARSVGESWGLSRPQWVSDRWTGGRSRAQVGASRASRLLRDPRYVGSRHRTENRKSTSKGGKCKQLHLWSLAWISVNPLTRLTRQTQTERDTPM